MSRSKTQGQVKLPVDDPKLICNLNLNIEGYL